MFENLLVNITLLISLSFFYNYIIKYYFRKAARHSYQIFSGILFGVISILGMNMPVDFAPGIIFDGRSIILSLAGLFGGPLVTGIATIFALLFRIYLGGVGVLAGILSIVGSGFVGIVFRYFLKDKNLKITSVQLLLMGVASTITVLLSQLILPWDTASRIFTKIAIPILIIFPIVTMIIGVFIVDELENIKLLDRIKQNESLFHALAENAPVGIFHTNKDGKITYVNSRYSRICGLRPEVIIDGGWLKTVHPDDLEKIKKIWGEDLHKGLELKAEFRYLTVEGEIRWVSGKAAPYYKEDGTVDGYVGTIAEITERKEAECALRKSEESLKIAQSVAQMGDWQYDLIQNKTRWSENCFKLYGLEPNEIEPTYEYFLNRIHEDDKHFIEEAYQKIIATKELQEVELRILFPGKQIKWFQNRIIPEFEGNQLVALKGVNMDVTEHKLADLELENQRKLFETMFNAMTDGVVIADTNRNIILANRGMTKTFGYLPEELTGKSTEILYANKDHFDAAGRVVFNDDASQSNQLYITEYRDKEGNNFPGETFGAKLYDSHNQWIGNVAIMQDITQRVESENALKKSKKQYQYLFDNNPMPLLIYDVETMEIIRVNKAAIRKYGYSHSEFLNLTIKDIRPEDDILNFKTHFDDVVINSDDFVESGIWRHKTKTGEVIHVEIISNKIEYKNRQARLVIAYDVSERIRALKALKASESNYRSLFENHSAVKLMVDPHSGQIIHANQAAADFYGWSIDELKSMTIFQLNTEEKAVLQRSLRSTMKKQREHFEYEHRLANGSIRNVEIFTSRIFFEGRDCLHSIVHDVTEQKTAKQKLKLFEKVIEQSPVGIMITDRSGKVEYINCGFSEMTGYQRDDVIGRDSDILNSGFHEKAFFKEMWDRIQAGNDWIGELRNRKKNGELYWERQIISPIKNSKGAITNFVGIKENITERKQMISDLVEAKEKAEEAEKLKSAFLANMSHEIRTPLNAILGFSNILHADPELSKEQKEEYIQIINRSSDSLLQIINDVLDASRIETGQVKIRLQPFNLNRMLEQLHTQYQKVIDDLEKQNIQLKLLSPTKPVIMNADENRLSQVFTSLLNNAVKFTSSGQISFGIGDFSNGSIEFVVQDTGIGIPEKDHDSVFERFRQVEVKTTRLYGGNGLGLTIAKSLTELMGGKMELKSKEGEGTTFHFWIPNNQVN